MKILLSFFFLLFSNFLFAQPDSINLIAPNKDSVAYYCLFNTYSFHYQKEVEGLINRVTAVSGSYYRSFNVKECSNLQTGCKAIKDLETDTWYLLYNAQFIQTLIEKDTSATQIDSTKWNQLIRLLQEVGIIVNNQNNKTANIELEVAAYIGRTCGRLGIALDPLIQGYQQLALDQQYKASKDSRLNQLKIGWKKDQSNIKAETKQVVEEISQLDVLMMNENFPVAFPILKKHQNHPLFEARHMNYLGLVYDQKNGPEQDHIKKITWYQKAAERGLIRSMGNLANTYRSSKGNIKNLKKSSYWSKKAADAGYRYEAYRIGWDYLYGPLKNRNNAKGMQWLKLAANRGSAPAMFNLGYCYQYGRVTISDLQKAKFWYEKAAHNGYAKAMNRLVTYFIDDYVLQEKWLLIADKKGSTTASRDLAYLYQTNLYNPEEAFFWAEKAVSMDDHESLGYLAILYLIGNTPDGKDLEKAKSLLERAITKRAKSGMFAKGLLYFLEEKNYKKAIRWIPKSDSSDFRALHLLGCMHLQGIGVKKDFHSALKYFKLAEEKTEIPVLESLNRLGINVEKIKTRQ